VDDGIKLEDTYCRSATRRAPEFVYPVRLKSANTGHWTEIIALEQPFAACGKLRPKLMEPGRIARSAQMPLDEVVPQFRRFRNLVNS
jgi:hypothetical protein